MKPIIPSAAPPQIPAPHKPGNTRLPLHRLGLARELNTLGDDVRRHYRDGFGDMRLGPLAEVLPFERRRAVRRAADRQGITAASEGGSGRARE